MAARLRTHARQWRFGASSTLRGIYVIRYFLFAGGLAILGALIQRSASGEGHSVLGLLLGLAAGLFVFRGQLSALRWPELLLTQEGVYLVNRKKPAGLPWEAIDEVAHRNGTIAIRMRGSPTNPPAEIELQARQYGTSSEVLAKAISQLAAEPQLRSVLPTVDQLKRAGAVPATVSSAPAAYTDRG